MPYKVISNTENSFKVLFDHNPQPMWIVNVETLRFVAVNDAAVKHYGYSHTEFLNVSLSKIRPPYEHSAMLELIHTIKDKQTIKEELTHIKKNGEIMFVNITSYTINFQNSECRLVIINDITLEKVKNEKLRTAWKKLRQILDYMTHGFIMLNGNLQLTYINKEAQKILGIKKRVSLNKHIVEAIPEIKNTTLHISILNSFVTFKSEKFELYLPQLNKWIYLTIYPDRSGVPIYFTDITAEKESGFRNKDHINKLEELAYLNSHVIRKEVANILGISNLLENEVDDRERLIETIKMLSSSVSNLDGILKAINSKIEK